MRKTTKSLLLTALILFCLGILLTLSGFLTVKIMGIDPFGIPHSSDATEDKTYTLEEILAQSPNSNYIKKLSTKEFTRIDITSFAGDVIIEGGCSETKLELSRANTSNLAIEINGETLTFAEKNPVGFLGFFFSQDGISFKGLRQIFGPANAVDTRRTVKLYLAEGVTLNQIDLRTDYGDVTVSKIDSELVHIKSKFGSAHLSELSCENGKIILQGGIGNVSLSDNRYTSCNVSLKWGKITTTVPEGDAQSTVLDSWIGSVDILTDLPTSYYKLSLSTTIGSVVRNDEESGKELNTPSLTTSRISSHLILGKVSIRYRHGNEADYIPPSSESEQTSEETQEETVMQNTAAEFV